MNPLLNSKVGGGRNPVQEGVLARAAGWSKDDCPYASSPEAEEWRAGWDEEDRLLSDEA